MAGVDDFSDEVDQTGRVIPRQVTPAPSTPGVTPDLGQGVSSFSEPYTERPSPKVRPELQTGGFTPSKNPNWLKAYLEDIQRISASPGGPPVIPSMMEAAKGIPVAGHHMPQTEAMTELETNNPGKAAFQRFTGGAAASTVPFGLAAKGTEGLGLLAETMGQGGMGAGLGVADKVSEKGTDVTKEELQSEAERGGFFGSLGGPLAKLLSPGYRAAQLRAGRDAPGSTPTGIAAVPQSEIQPPSAAVGPRSKEFNDLLKYSLENDPLGEAGQTIGEMPYEQGSEPFDLPKVFQRERDRQAALRAHQMAREGAFDPQMAANKEATETASHEAREQSIKDVTESAASVGNPVWKNAQYHEAWLRHFLMASAAGGIGFETGQDVPTILAMAAGGAALPHAFGRYVHNTGFQDMGPMLNAGLYNILGKNDDASLPQK